MEARYYVTCLWPGLAELWWRGRLSALPAAIAFTCAFNLWLVTRYLYPEWIAGGLVSMAFWIGIVVWLFSTVRSVRELPALITPRIVSEQPDRFPEAREAYLGQQWSEAEGLLVDVLAIEPRDPPALLLLTGVYRHTGRLEAAEVLLEEIARLEVADGWWLEVEAEARRLKRAIDAANDKQTSKADEENLQKTEETAADLTDAHEKAA
jgi:thioredoxin-like negative regulator of GroEL